MTFTPLDTILISVIVSAVTGYIVKVKSVNPRDCRIRRDSCEQLRKDEQELNRKILRALTAIVHYSDMPEAEKLKLQQELSEEV